jgi:predicted metal-dependent phosphoesterase TrpH
LVDLHIHSNASDGTYSPEEIIDIAVRSGISAISITDHDTLDGVKKALEKGIPDGLDFVTGVEISSSPPDGCYCAGSFHVLGYGVDTENVELLELLARQKQARLDRNPKMLEKLRGLGIDIPLKDVEAEASGGQPGRPHIAVCMVKAGYVRNLETAFDRYIAKGRPAYVEKEKIPCDQAIAIISRAGGVSVLAHPGLLRCHNDSPFDRLFSCLCDMGLGGIEAYYTGHSESQTAMFEGFAKRKKLIVTGGSDFHGKIKPDIRIGTGRGSLRVPYSYFIDLKKALSSVSV